MSRAVSGLSVETRTSGALSPSCRRLFRRGSGLRIDLEGDGATVTCVRQIDAVVDSKSRSPVLLSKAQEALRQSEERFRLLVTSVKDYAIFMLNPDGTVRTDAANNPLPTYDQTTVNNFTLLFTGWNLCEASLEWSGQRRGGGSGINAGLLRAHRNCREIDLWQRRDRKKMISDRTQQ